MSGWVGKQLGEISVSGGHSVLRAICRVQVGSGCGMERKRGEVEFGCCGVRGGFVLEVFGGW